MEKLTQETKKVEKSTEEKFVESMARKAYELITNERQQLMQAINQVFADLQVGLSGPDWERKQIRLKYSRQIVALIKKWQAQDKKDSEITERMKKTRIVRSADSFKRREEARAGQTYEETDLE